MDATPLGTNAPDRPACPGCRDRDDRIARLERQLKHLQDRLAKVEAQRDAATRARKRQAAPFSKGPPKADPKTPGRKPGAGYGTAAHRPPPPVIDEVLDAPLPARCACGGEIRPDAVEHQYQTEIPRKPIHRQFNVHVGHCAACGKRAQGRHPLQTSDALGCCASQMGPDAQAAIVLLNKDAGLSHGKMTALFGTLFGIPLTRGGACQAMLRAAGRCRPHYDAILGAVARAPWVVADETGWRVGGRPAWVHVAVCEAAVAYTVARGRGFEATTRLVPADFAGVLVHDGWRSYLLFTAATHQTCTAHLLRRCHEMLGVATGGAVAFPRRVAAILRAGLAARDERDAGLVTPAAAIATVDALQAQVRSLCGPAKANAANDRLAAHLFLNQRHLFAHVRVAGVDATNWRAEQALKTPIVNRKVWGGNRTEAGAAAQGILASVLKTLAVRGVGVIDWLGGLFRSPATTPLLVPRPDG